jgi:hypothetical protein
MSGRTIHLLCPTVRPEMMKSTLEQWITTAVRKDRIRIKVAVNTDEDRSRLLYSLFSDILVIGTKRPGAPYAVFRLFQAVEGLPEDIVVLVSDDTFAPTSWDDWLEKQFDGHDDAIIVDDGWQYGACVTQPIMTYGCVLKLNRVVNHPSYNHFCADAELFVNLSEMGLVRDLRRGSGQLFEHRNWAGGKRAKDKHDERNISLWGVDEHNQRTRLSLPVKERLKVDPSFFSPL